MFYLALQDWERALLVLWWLMARNPRTRFIHECSLLKPRVEDENRIRDELDKERSRQKRLYDKNAKNIPPLEEQQGVRFLNPHDKKWYSGIVVELCSVPRSVIIRETDTGKTWCDTGAPESRRQSISEQQNE